MAKPVFAIPIISVFFISLSLPAECDVSCHFIEVHNDLVLVVYRIYSIHAHILLRSS